MDFQKIEKFLMCLRAQDFFNPVEEKQLDILIQSVRSFKRKFSDPFYLPGALELCQEDNE